MNYLSIYMYIIRSKSNNITFNQYEILYIYIIPNISEYTSILLKKLFILNVHH